MKSDDLAPLEQQWAQRPTKTLGAQFITNPEQQSPEIEFICAPDDQGVWRNGGRAGAAFAPQALLACFKKLHPPLNVQRVFHERFLFERRPCMSFDEIHRLRFKLQAPITIHLGGGNDHVLGLLRSCEDHHQKPLLIFNIDPHLDTRVDQALHSGTPFRQFDRLCKRPFTLIQVGTQGLANAPENYRPLHKGKMIISNELDWPQLARDFKDHCWVLALDCDAIEFPLMPAVSAVAYRGLSAQALEAICLAFKEHSPSHIYGLYEYNPKYDDLALSSGRFLAQLLYRLIFDPI